MSQIFKPWVGSFIDFRCPQVAGLVSRALGASENVEITDTPKSSTLLNKMGPRRSSKSQACNLTGSS